MQFHAFQSRTGAKAERERKKPVNFLYPLFCLTPENRPQALERSRSIFLVPMASVGTHRVGEQQSAATSSPLVPCLFLNVPWDLLSCVSCSMCSSGSLSRRGALVLFSARRPLVTSSVAVASGCVILLSELSDLPLDEVSSSAMEEHSPVSWSSCISWWTGLPPLLSFLSWASLAVGNKIRRPTLSVFQHKNQQLFLLL